MKAYLDLKEMVALENAAINLRDKLLIRLLCRTGCRISEALALTADNIDFERGTITIEHLKARISLSCPRCRANLARGHTFCPKCGAKIEGALAAEQQRRRMRAIPVDEDTLATLANYIKRGGPVTRGGQTLIFGISRHRAWQVVRDCAARAGLPSLVSTETGRARGVSPHRLRDAFAVNAIKHDDTADGLRLLQEHLGHAGFNTTMRYRKVSGEEQREWYAQLWEENRQ